MAESRPYTGGKFSLEFDDKQSAGFVNSIEGGHFKSAGPVQSMVGHENYVTKYTGKPVFDDITISVGAAMSTSFWKWVGASLDNKPERRNGALVGYDFNFKERTRRSFFDALISEIQFPALDASSKNAAAITIKIAPERIEFKKGDGSSLSGGQAQDQMSKQKMWLTQNFRFELERFKGDSSLRNCKIEAFTVKQNIVSHSVGYSLTPEKLPGRLELPQIVVTFPESQVEPWMKWFDHTIGRGNRLDQTTTGMIAYYASDSNKTELMRVELAGVSLVSLEIDKYEAHKEAIASAKATLSVEKLVLKGGKGTV
jgi:phage tail-like protein